MKSSLVQFFSSNQVIALTSAASIFILTIFLVAKRWIGFSITFILLLFALIAGILINNPQFLNEYSATSNINLERQEAFKKQILDAIDEMKLEVSTEKENFLHLKDQMQDIFKQLDAQKQKLENFIEETREHFQNEKHQNSESTNL